MDRLTSISEITGLPIVKELQESCGEDACADVCDENRYEGCVGCPVQKAITKLFAYEDTGLTPEEVKIAMGVVRAAEKWAKSEKLAGEEFDGLLAVVAAYNIYRKGVTPAQTKELVHFIENVENINAEERE